ncbi:MAG TPA: endonuclease/exonuclease/phosphatase family protein [Sphaerochaeta sp.]|nr:endonuclease/exonuclease/phosphatase family protein [Sphaerochaeta sp.]
MKRFPLLLLLILVLLLSVGCGCTLDAQSSNPKEFKVLTYNVQNLMDDKLDGDEYPEYRPSEKWKTASYHMRLRTLNEVLTSRSIGLCDVLVLQEVEHQGVVADLLERHLARKGYRWYAVAKGEGSAIATAVISRKAPKHVAVHAVEGARPVLEAVFDTERGDIAIFALHAKSQIGDFPETEALRLALSAVLKGAARRHEGSLTLFCGDFNTNPDSYKNNPLVQPALIDIQEQKARLYMGSGTLGITGRRDLVYSDVWYSPYLDGHNRFDKPGTCYFGGAWHRYDQFLGNGLLFDGLGWEYGSTAIIAPSAVLKADGTPMAWALSTLSGVSDHLPVLLTLLRR